MSEFVDAGKVVVVNSLKLGVFEKYLERLAEGKARLPDSLLIIDANDEIIGVGDFTPIEQCATLEPLDVAREQAAQKFLDGIKKGMEGAGELVAHELTPEELAHIVSGRLPE